jgi:hypothetical protein
VLRRIFGPKRDEGTGGGRKLHNEELHDLYSSPSTITMIRAGHVVQMIEERNVCMYVNSGKAEMKETTKNTKMEVSG